MLRRWRRRWHRVSRRELDDEIAREIDAFVPGRSKDDWMDKKVGRDDYGPDGLEIELSDGTTVNTRDLPYEDDEPSNP